MTKLEQTSAFTRRSMLLGSGALVVSIGAAVSFDTLLSMRQAFAQGTRPPLTPDQLSSYIAVNADGTVSAYFGKMDMGHGIGVAIGQTFDAGGPEVMTYREMIERIAGLRHKHPVIVEVPFLTPRLSSLWLRLVTPVQAGVARPLIDGLRNPTVAHDTRLLELVPFQLTSFDAAAQAAITAAANASR